MKVRASRPPAATTSSAAGAIWALYLVDGDDRVLEWGEVSRKVFHQLAKDRLGGVRLVHGIEASRHPVPPPSWLRKIDASRLGSPLELPEGFATGWWYTAPVIDMPAYLRYLTERFTAAGGQIEIGTIRSLAEATSAAPLVVNCTGMGARSLVPDSALVPVRGQLVVVENPGIGHFFLEYGEGADLTYFLPHGDHLVLGGSAETGRSETAPDLRLAERILHRCAELEPALRSARVLGHRVGLRPSRPRIRVERRDIGSRHVIHNYGHGGAGVTVSWGCAEEVLALVGTL